MMMIILKTYHRYLACMAGPRPCSVYPQALMILLLLATKPCQAFCFKSVPLGIIFTSRLKDSTQGFNPLTLLYHIQP